MPKRVADVRSHPQQAIEDERLGSFRDQTTSTQALQRVCQRDEISIIHQ